ncbi:MAG: hypothetical protein IJY46_02975 [Lentisphaeria bacterium]|nr:hypothetical protein [Lentisphaeria bacterium]
MKKQLLLSALALLGAGALSGCCSNCCSNGGDCDDFIAVEAVEVVPCPAGKKCKDGKHHHLRKKDSGQKMQKNNAGNCTDSSCSVHGQTALANCGSNCGNTGSGSADTTGHAETAK